MLGHNARLERKLKQDGKQAWATVLESKKEWTSSGGINKAPGQAGSFTTHQKLRLRVEPDGESPFEVTVSQVFHDIHGWPIPQEGWSVTVMYDAADHSKVVIDMDKMPVAPGLDRNQVAARHDQAIERQKMREEAAQAAVAGRAAAPSHEPAAGAEQIRAIARDASLSAEEKRAKIMELSTNMLGGPKTMLAGGPVISAPGVAGPAAAVESLTKLADLRDRGVLTDDEFDAQKRKLLDE